MLRHLVRLVVLALVLHAIVRVAPEFWHYLQFKDAVLEAATYAGRQTPEQVRDKVVRLAAEHGVPVSQADVAVSRQGDATLVWTAWTAQLEFLPTRFYPYEFVVDVEGRPQRFASVAAP